MFSGAVRILFLFGVLFFVDRFTKVAALFLFSDRAQTVLPGFFQFSLFMHAKDFLFFDQATFSWVGVFVLLLLGYLFPPGAKSARSSYYAATVAAGVASNVLDSIRYGAVIDWIEIPGITFFNLSDVFIIGGCVGICWTFFFKQSKG